MDNVFSIREAGVNKPSSQAGRSTSFAFGEAVADERLTVERLPLNCIVFVVKGSIEFSCNQYERVAFRSGEMAFFLRASSVSLRALKDAEMYVFSFDALLAADDRKLFDAWRRDAEAEPSQSPFTPVAIPKAVVTLLRNLQFFDVTDADLQPYNELKHRELFLLLRHYTPKQQLLSMLKPLLLNLTEFRQVVLDRYGIAEEGGVKALADLTGMSRKNFERRFREEFGASPARWLIERKAEKLRLFLQQPGVRIADAMVKFRFNSPSHFNAFCRRHLGATPGAVISG